MTWKTAPTGAVTVSTQHQPRLSRSHPLKLRSQKLQPRCYIHRYRKAEFSWNSKLRNVFLNADAPVIQDGQSANDRRDKLRWNRSEGWTEKKCRNCYHAVTSLLILFSPSATHPTTPICVCVCVYVDDRVNSAFNSVTSKKDMWEEHWWVTHVCQEA